MTEALEAVARAIMRKQLETADSGQIARAAIEAYHKCLEEPSKEMMVLWKDCLGGDADDAEDGGYGNIGRGILYWKVSLTQARKEALDE